MPKVSVIIPCYNHEAYVADAIRSVLAQTLQDVEIIVVDDGSTDGSQQAVGAFGERVRYLWKPNAGLSAARNTGIHLAEGEFIGVLDSDDVYEPDFLRTLVDVLEANREAGAAYCGYQFVDEQLALLHQIENKVVDSAELYGTLIDGNYLAPECILVRRSTYQAVGDFDVTLTACEDWDMWLRIARRYTVIGIPDVLIKHRVLSDSMSSDPVRMLNNRLVVLRKHLGDLVPSSPRPVRKALGLTYLRTAVEFLEHADSENAQQCVTAMLEICPELSADLSVYYELGVGGQHKGSRGDLEALNLEQNGAVLINMLEKVFANSTTLKAQRAPSFATAYLALGTLNYGVGNMKAARKWLRQSLTVRPSGVVDQRISSLLVKSYLKPLLLK